MTVKVDAWVNRTVLLVHPTTTTVWTRNVQLQGPTHGLRGQLEFLVGICCRYSQKPPEFSVDYDPFEDFFGMGIDMKTRKQVGSNEDSQPSYGGNKREVPCPVCRGRGYIFAIFEGPRVCSYCHGKYVVLEDSVRDPAWETAQTRSPLKVVDDEALDRVDPESVRRPSQRVYGPRSDDVRKRISRTLKELERRTGVISKRVKKQHQNPVIHAQMVAAIKRAKNTEASKKKVSDKQKQFFQNPENRRMRSIQMKGVKFSCKQCGKEGHRCHYCPDLGYVKKVPSISRRPYRCGLCKQPGHQRRNCPCKDQISAEDAEPWGRKYKPRAKGTKRRTYKCGCCQQLGHTRRSCSELRRENSFMDG